MELRSDARALYVISVAAELAGVHPQTLRIYERKGLLEPARTSGGNRRYSNADLQRLRRIHELMEEGMNIAGVTRILALEERVAALQAEVIALSEHARRADDEAVRRQRRDLVPLHQSVAVFGQVPSILRRD
jgi:MerR family transcriptional regulator, heat shock protein HspR